MATSRPGPARAARRGPRQVLAASAVERGFSERASSARRWFEAGEKFSGFLGPPPPSGEVGGRGKSERRESRNQLRPQGSLKRRVSAEAVMPGLKSVGQEERRPSSVFSIPRSTHPPLPCLFTDGHSCLSHRKCQCEEDAPRRRMAWRRVPEGARPVTAMRVA
jgi:hypothetical protein